MHPGSPARGLSLKAFELRAKARDQSADLWLSTFQAFPSPSLCETGLVMSALHRRDYDYPEQTRGSEAARRFRAKANKLTPSQRTELQRRAMQLIYAGTGDKEAVRSRQ